MSDDYKVIKAKEIEIEIEIDHIDRYDQLSKGYNVRKLRSNIINVKKSVIISNSGLSKLGFKFGTIGMDFLCNNNKLINLIGMPYTIDRNCGIEENKDLVTFKYGPDYVGHNFNVRGCSFRSFEHCPRVVGEIFNISANRITSLTSIHKHLIRCNSLNLSYNPIEEGGIGLILIEDLKNVTYLHNSNGRAYCDKVCCLQREFDNALKIIRKYLGQGKKALLQCQEELTEAGLERFARL